MKAIEIFRNIRLTNRTSLDRTKNIFKIISELCLYNCGTLDYEKEEKEELKSNFKVIGSQDE